MFCYWVTLLVRHTQHDICICMATSSRNDEALSRNDEALSRNDGALSRNDGAVFRNPKLWNSTELHRMETKQAIPSKCGLNVFVMLAWLFCHVYEPTRKTITIGVTLEYHDVAITRRTHPGGWCGFVHQRREPPRCP